MCNDKVFEMYIKWNLTTEIYPPGRCWCARQGGQPRPTWTSWKLWTKGPERQTRTKRTERPPRRDWYRWGEGRYGREGRTWHEGPRRPPGHQGRACMYLPPCRRLPLIGCDICKHTVCPASRGREISQSRPWIRVTTLAYVNSGIKNHCQVC